MIVLLNNLGSNTEVTNSVIGVNGSVSGTPTYATAKFGNGITLNTSNYAYFNNSTLPTSISNKGSIAFWIKHTEAYSSAPTDRYTKFIDGMMNNYNFSIGLDNTGGNDYGLTCRINEGPTRRNYCCYYDVRAGQPMTWANGDLQFWQFVWDRDSTDSVRMKMYINQTELTDRHYIINNQWTADQTFTNNMIIGTSNTSQHVEGIIDNVALLTTTEMITATEACNSTYLSYSPVSGVHYQPKWSLRKLTPDVDNNKTSFTKYIKDIDYNFRKIVRKIADIETLLERK